MNDSSTSNKKLLRIFVNSLVIYFFVFVSFIMSNLLPNEYLRTASFYCSTILLTVLFASLAERAKSLLGFRFLLFLSFFVLFFVYGFRDFSAIDDLSYIRIFNDVTTLGWFSQFKTTTMEPGYLILNSVIGVFTSNYFYVQLISSLIPLSIFYYGFSKYRNIISLPTAVFFFCCMLYFQMLAVGLVRMFIALSIVFTAFKYLAELNPKIYIFLIILATTFHYSAFFMIFLVYFAIKKERITKRMTKTFFLISIISPFVFILISKLLVPFLGSRYNIYASVKSIELSLTAFSSVPIILLLLFFYKKFNIDEQMYFKIFVMIYSLSLIISLFGSIINLERLIFYSYSALILGISMISKKIRFNSSKIIFLSIIILYGFLYLYSTQFTVPFHIPYLFPYRNIYFKV